MFNKIIYNKPFIPLLVFNIITMKSLSKILAIVLAAMLCINAVSAQTPKENKKADVAAAIKRMVSNLNYVFKAEYVTPLRGGGKSITGRYDVTVSKDKLIVFLPYYGRAYSAPIDATDGGIKITTTRFSYKAEENKKGGWDVMIIPKDKDMSGVQDVQQLRFYITPDGYATLQVNCLNRDAISFNGTIEEVKNEK